MHARQNPIVAFTLLVLVSLVGFVAAERSAGCGKNPTITSKQYTISVNGKQRQYFVKLPDRYNKDTAHKLIFTW